MCEVKVSIIATAIENSTLEIHCMFFEKIYLCIYIYIYTHIYICHPIEM